MKACRILVFALMFGLTSTAFAQLSFDFEGATTLTDLTDAGWVLVDDQTIDIGGVPTQFLDTIKLETTIVHGGGQSLRLGVRDIAFFPLNDEFGTLELWCYDEGQQIATLPGIPASVYGPRFGLRKYMDVDTSGYYPDYEPVDYGILNRAYGIGAGLLHKSWLGSDAGYATEWGSTQNIDIAVIGSDAFDYDPVTASPYAGWAGDQSWFSATWGGYLPGGRPMYPTGGWNHWRVAYTAPGVVEITLIQSWAGDSASPAGTPAGPFDGTVVGGVSDIYLYGGSSLFDEGTGETWFGDGIFDDITWTPASTPCSPGDADDDGDVDLDDFVILKNNFGNATGMTCSEGDFDGDGDVDLDDFVLLKNNFGS